MKTTLLRIIKAIANLGRKRDFGGVVGLARDRNLSPVVDRR